MTREECIFAAQQYHEKIERRNKSRAKWARRRRIKLIKIATAVIAVLVIINLA